MILGSEFLETFRRRIETVPSHDDQKVMTNFYQDVVGNRSYVIGGYDLEVFEALALEDLYIFSYAIADFRPAPEVPNNRPSTQMRCIYGRPNGEPSRDDWEYMSNTVRECLAVESRDTQLDPDSLLLPRPAQAAILMASQGGKFCGIFVFDRKLSRIEGLTILHKALFGQTNGIGAGDVFPVEQVQ